MGSSASVCRQFLHVRVVKLQKSLKVTFLSSVTRQCSTFSHSVGVFQSTPSLDSVPLSPWLLKWNYVSVLVCAWGGKSTWPACITCPWGTGQSITQPTAIPPVCLACRHTARWDVPLCVCETKWKVARKRCYRDIHKLGQVHLQHGSYILSSREFRCFPLLFAVSHEMSCKRFGTTSYLSFTKLTFPWD